MKKKDLEEIENSLNVEPKSTVRDSVIEILNAIQSGKIDPRDSEFSNMSKLTEKINALHNYNFDENL